MEAGHNIFVQSDDNRKDGDEYRSLRSRAEGELKDIPMDDDKNLEKRLVINGLMCGLSDRCLPIKLKGIKKNKKTKEEGEQEKG